MKKDKAHIAWLTRQQEKTVSKYWNDAKNVNDFCDWPIFEKSILEMMKAEFPNLKFEWRIISFSSDLEDLKFICTFSDNYELNWSVSLNGYKNNRINKDEIAIFFEQKSEQIRREAIFIKQEKLNKLLEDPCTNLMYKLGYTVDGFSKNGD